MKVSRIFSNKKAREFLLKNGFVYTFRREEWNLGKIWIKQKRTGKKIADGVVSEKHYIPNLKLLSDFAMCSGFEDVEEWIRGIKEFHGNIENGWVYKVELDS